PPCQGVAAPTDAMPVGGASVGAAPLRVGHEWAPPLYGLATSGRRPSTGWPRVGAAPAA
ncbi:hypothetical protein BHE74_00039569, partial [Ensete ventricosum]